MTEAVAIRNDATLRKLNLTEDDFLALRDSIASGASPSEFRMHLMICARLGLSPVGGQAHFVKRRDSRLNRDVFTTQVGIDGYRSLAEDTNQYQGPAGLPEFQYESDGPWTTNVDVKRPPYAAKVGVWRKGWKQPVYAVALYAQYVQTYWDSERKERVPNAIWQQRAHPQLAKCAEALALRQAFPRKLGGIYTREEMGAQDPETIDVTAKVVETVEATLPPLTAEQRKALVALGNQLPLPDQAKPGQATRWPAGKYASEYKRLGSFGAVKEQLEKELATVAPASESKNDTVAHEVAGNQPEQPSLV